AEARAAPRHVPRGGRGTGRNVVGWTGLWGGGGGGGGGVGCLGGGGGRGDGGRVRRWTMVDVGTGAGDIPIAAVDLARRYGIDLVPIGLERIPAAAREAQQAGLFAVLADGNALPFADR